MKVIYKRGQNKQEKEQSKPKKYTQIFPPSDMTERDEQIIFVVDLSGYSQERYEITVDIFVGFPQIHSRKLFISLSLSHTHTHTHTRTHTHTCTPLTVAVAQVGHVSLLDILLKRQPAEESGHSR